MPAFIDGKEVFTKHEEALAKLTEAQRMQLCANCPSGHHRREHHESGRGTCNFHGGSGGFCCSCRRFKGKK
jgi:hypothetical protein